MLGTDTWFHIEHFNETGTRKRPLCIQHVRLPLCNVPFHKTRLFLHHGDGLGDLQVDGFVELMIIQPHLEQPIRSVQLAKATRELVGKTRPQAPQTDTKFWNHVLTQVQCRIHLLVSAEFPRQAMQDGRPSPPNGLQLLVCEVLVETVPAPGQPKIDGFQGCVGGFDGSSGQALGKRRRFSLCEHW